uniref:LR gamma7 n=1 Tax=Griffithsia pacifica TaxID=35689 RepID=A0A291FEC0_GRIPA|nr:LR gamma7 [Griffithsia pacifica]5Y6P_eY Chain eY, LR_gamma7 [Griffithsia pacifica]5Y6P_eZ Chain eZ, LR_gamma7 [Griffithsia pacifica]
MTAPAFTAPISLTTPHAFSARGLRPATTSSAAPTAVPTPRMSAADKYMARTVTRTAKSAAAGFGVYTPQCTEASGGANTAEATRLAVLAADFRLRQAPLGARFADLYETRRAAVIQACNSSAEEGYATSFPSRAAASVAGRAEGLRACSRYFPQKPPVEEYMAACVDRQYKQMRVHGGVYSTLCADGRSAGDADTARIAALGARFRAQHLSKSQQTQMRYNAMSEARMLARGLCTYEEAQFNAYPKMAGMMRYGTGVYAASVRGPELVVGNKSMTVAEQVNGVNAESYWPSSKVRPAVARGTSPWMGLGVVKSYAAMSEAAMAYGIEQQSKPYVPQKYEGWSSGWKPKSSLM